MSLQPRSVPPVPEETARIARAVFGPQHPYLKLRDELGPLFQDDLFAELFPTRGQPAEAPWRLALVTLLQFAEGLSDRQAADAVRSRLDWKYLLSLEVTDPGFHYSVLSEFRDRLVVHQASRLLFDTLLARCRERQWLKSRGCQRTDSTHVLSAVRNLSRLELVGETLRHVLDVLAMAVPDWLVRHSLPEWVERYGASFATARLPRAAAERERLARQMGADGWHLWQALGEDLAPSGLRELPAVVTLHRVWLQQYTWEEAPQARETPRLRWREMEELPPAGERLVSPHDPDARYAKKREVGWSGYKIQITETCEADRPLLITDVQTTPATRDDSELLPVIQEQLAQRELLPALHLVDTGYVEGSTLLGSQQRQVDLLGPDQADTSWQARENGGFAAQDFCLDWEAQQVTCPGGKKSVGWRERQERGRPVIRCHFARGDCGPCPHRADCTHSEAGGRQLVFPPREVYEVLQAARQRATTPEFAQQYAARAGVEGTHSQAVRRCGLRRARYVGLAKVHLQHLLTGAALNLVRVADWLCAQPRARTRVTAFARSMAAAGIC